MLTLQFNYEQKDGIQLRTKTEKHIRMK